MRMTMDDDEIARRLGEEISSGRYHSTLRLSRELGIPELRLLRNLPEEGFKEVPPDRFEEILENVSTWGPVLIIVKAPNANLEVVADLPHGERGRNFYHLKGGALTAYLRESEMDAVLFVTQEVYGRESFSIQLFDRDGAAMLKVFLPRKDNGELDVWQKRAYTKLMSRY